MLAQLTIQHRDRVSHRLHAWLAAQQNFGARMFADNLHAVAVLEATALCNTPEQYKLNRTYAFAHLKRCMPRWLPASLPTGQEGLTMFEELARNLIRFISGATKPRPVHPKPHRKHAYKA